jgi:hypothetical protein
VENREADALICVRLLLISRIGGLQTFLGGIFVKQLNLFSHTINPYTSKQINLC